MTTVQKLRLVFISIASVLAFTFTSFAVDVIAYTVNKDKPVVNQWVDDGLSQLGGGGCED